MKNIKYILAVLTMAGLAANADVVNIGDSSDGGNDASAIASWSTDNVEYDGSNTGMAFNWEGVDINTSAAGSGVFDIEFKAGPGLTIGHGYLMTESFDLSTTQAGIEGMAIDLDMNASGYNNWIPMIAVGGVLYRYNSSGNAYNGTGAITVGNSALNATDTSWVQLVGPSAGTIDATKGSANPDLSATSGIVQFGFIQWASQSSGTIGDTEPTTYTLAIDSFNYGITSIPEPATLGMLAAFGGGLLFIRRRLMI